MSIKVVKWNLRVKVTGGALAILSEDLVQFPATTVTKQRSKETNEKKKPGINVRERAKPEKYIVGIQEDILGEILLARELWQDTHVHLPEDVTYQQAENSPSVSLCHPSLSQGSRFLIAKKREQHGRSNP